MKPAAFFLLILFVFAPCYQADAQLKNLGKRIKKKVNNRINRRFDQGVDKGLDEVEKGVGDTVEGEGEAGTANDGQAGGDQPANPTAAAGAQAVGEFQVNTKFDYVPGEALLVFDDFSQDAVGDFPARWNTDGTGEVVTFGNTGEKWFLMKSGSHYIPDLPGPLPEEYTVEFDLAATGLDKNTASTCVFEVVLDDNNVFNRGKNHVRVRIPFCQYHPVGFYVNNRVNSQVIINNQIEGDIRQQVKNQPHVSIAVNKTRFRMWINEQKYIDIPRLVPPNSGAPYLKFTSAYFRDGKEDIFLRNLKIAEGGLDLRAQLLKDGMVSTNGILFDVNSANIQPESYGVIRQIALAMQESGDMKLNIIGHTDSDGADDANLNLSQRRAEAVKTTLVEDFGIPAGRLQVEGKGESEPVAENNTTEGKAANRRVEFVSL